MHIFPCGLWGGHTSQTDPVSAFMWLNGGGGAQTCKNRPPQHLLIHCVVSVRGPARKATEPVAVYEAELGNISLLTLWRRLFEFDWEKQTWRPIWGRALVQGC